MTYFVIDNSDGDTYVRQMTRTQVEQMLVEWDEMGEQAGEFLSEVPEADTNYWGGKTLIIKGEIVIPKPVETVTTWEVP